MAPSKSRKSHIDKTDKEQGIFTIPELRVAFDHIEDFLHNLVPQQKSTDETAKLLKEEWKRTFHKELDEESAKSYIEHVTEEMKRGYRRNNHRLSRRSHKRRAYKGGGAQDATAPAMALQGAPMDYATRPGIYPAQGQTSGYGPVTEYISNGFNVAVPQQGYKVDQDVNLMGARLYPTVPEQSGTLSLRGGGGKGQGRRSSRNSRSSRNRVTRRDKNRRQGGGLSQFFSALSPAPYPHVYNSTNPPGTVQQLQQEFQGRPPMNNSSDASANKLDYQMNGKPLMIDPKVTSIKLPMNSVNVN